MLAKSNDARLQRYQKINNEYIFFIKDGKKC